MGTPVAATGQWELAARQLQAEKEALSTRLQGLGAREQQLLQELSRSQAKTEQLTQELGALQGSFQSELGQASSASAQVSRIAEEGGLYTHIILESERFILFG